MQAVQHQAVIRFYDLKKGYKYEQETILPYYASKGLPEKSIAAKFHNLYNDEYRIRFKIIKIDRFN